MEVTDGIPYTKPAESVTDEYRAAIEEHKARLNAIEKPVDPDGDWYEEFERSFGDAK